MLTADGKRLQALAAIKYVRDGILLIIELVDGANIGQYRDTLNKLREDEKHLRVKG